MKLSDLERIKRIEQAPKEIQTKVAKAFIRDDIPDENIQYLFNTTPLEEMNDKGVKIENKNAKQPDGIGTTNFFIRTYTPVDNGQFITRGWGGWSNCIEGFPMNDRANVLANCVGYASGRFNEIIQYARDYNECTYQNLNCNASYFVDRAAEDGLEIGNTPRVGSIMCWGGGNGDCGHVAVVEKVNSNNEVFTSESDYGGTDFYNATRNNDNGRWGLSSAFYFKGFIYQPVDVQNWIDRGMITPTVPRDEYKDQLEVIVPQLNVRTDCSTSSQSLGFAPQGIYNYYETRDNEGYTWYRIADNQWVAYNDEWEKVYPAKPKNIELEVIEEKDNYALVDLGKVWIEKK